jgi:hypothetical protein
MLIEDEAQMPLPFGEMRAFSPPRRTRSNARRSKPKYLPNRPKIGGIGQSTVDRLEQGLKNGAVLPATAAAVLGTSALYGHQLGASQ